jgi:Fur family ferric uptake transcriptional regulator
MTRQRKAIASAASAMRGAFTVEQLAAAVRDVDPAAGATATVYRAVSAMESAGYLERVGTRHGCALYASCADAEHHHHVVCDACGRTASAPCPVRHMPAAEGFVVTHHEVTLYGLCKACAEKSEC